MKFRPTWAEIDLSAIRHNFLQIKNLLDKDTAVLVAVKADAYGHGILQVSKVLVSAGVDYLGIGATDEGILLRKNGFKIPILMLGSILKEEIPAIVKNNIAQTVADIGIARCLNNYCKKIGKKAKIHIKIDTGMGRIGVWHEEAVEFVKAIAKFNNIEIEGIFSHFPSADEDEALTRKQIKDFASIIEELEKLGIYIKYKHMANSIAAINYKDSHMNLIRPGIMIYGLRPSHNTYCKNIKLRPVLSLKSKIVFLKDTPPGRRISYGGTHITKSHTKIATMPIGYGDGFSRLLSNRGFAIIRGEKAPVVGRVCMDQIMLDVGRIKGVKVGDEVTLIGKQKGASITAEEIACLCNTIPYEVTCWLNSRVARIYKD